MPHAAAWHIMANGQKFQKFSKPPARRRILAIFKECKYFDKAAAAAAAAAKNPKQKPKEKQEQKAASER